MQKTPLITLALLILFSTSIYNLEVSASHQDDFCSTLETKELGEKPLILEIPEITIGPNRKIKLLNLSEFIIDKDLKEIKIVEQSEQLDCMILQSNLMCTASINKGENGKVKIRVTNFKELYSEREIKVNILPEIPEIYDIEDFTFFDNSGIHKDLINLKELVYAPLEDIRDTRFYVLDQSNPSLVTCNIQKNNFLGCRVNEDKTGESKVTLEIKHNGYSIKKDFFIFVIQKCRVGNVNSNYQEEVLFVNDNTGDINNEMTLKTDDAITISIRNSSVGPSRPGVVIYAFLGVPTLNTERSQLFDLGTFCFPTELNKNDTLKRTLTLFNSLEDDFIFGEPILSKEYAPFSFNLTKGFRDEKVITLQGFIQDNNAPNSKRIARTNAIILKIKKR